jgi:hypothetical protein
MKFSRIALVGLLLAIAVTAESTTTKAAESTTTKAADSTTTKAAESTTTKAGKGKGGKGKGKGYKYKEVNCTGPREVELEEKKDGFEIKAGAKEKYCHDELKFKLKLKKDGAEMHLKIYQRDGPDRIKFEVKQKVYQVIEFDDKNDNNIVEEDEIVQKKKIGEPGWSPITFNETDGVYTVDASADWFKLQARYSGNHTELVESENRTYNLHPNAVKLDYIIENFPYSRDTTKLAVDGRFRTKSKIYEKKKKYLPKGKKVPGKYVEEIDFKNETAEEGGKFTWARNVTADGDVVPVVASPTQDAPPDQIDKPGKGEKNKKIVWVFDTTGMVDKFVWDPTLTGEEGNGYVSDNSSTTSGDPSTTSGDPSTFSSTFSTVAASRASSTIPTVAASLFSAALCFAF